MRGVGDDHVHRDTDCVDVKDYRGPRSMRYQRYDPRHPGPAIPAAERRGSAVQRLWRL